MSPILGIILLLLITLVLAGAVYALAPVMTPEGSSAATFGGSCDAATRTITLEHTGGATIDVEQLDMRITVDGISLSEQPPGFPFYNPPGFEGFPSGPFNPSTPNRWAPGELGRFTIENDNPPRPAAGSEVTLELDYQDRPLADINIECDG